MIEQIQNTWPPTHENLVNDYIKPFVKFIKSIYFKGLQLYVNTKDRPWRMYVNITNRQLEVKIWSIKKYQTL
jgi:hypothetical protein